MQIPFADLLRAKPLEMGRVVAGKIRTCTNRSIGIGIGGYVSSIIPWKGLEDGVE
jgi:hypothetical protein